MDIIISSKNITDESTIEILKNIAKSKDKKIKSSESSDVKLSSSSSSTNEVYLELNFNNSVFELTKDDEVIDDADTTMNDDVTSNNETRLRILLDESNKASLRKEVTNEDLKIKILELESKVKEYEIKIEVFEKLNLKNNCQTHLQEIEILKIKIQTLKTKTKILISTNVLRNDTTMNLDKMYMDQKSHDKLGTRRLRYEKSSSFSESKNPSNPKLKRKQTQTLNNKNVKNKNIQNNKKSHNYVFIYQHNSCNKEKNYQNNNRNTYNPNGPTKFILKVHMDCLMN